MASRRTAGWLAGAAAVLGGGLAVAALVAAPRAAPAGNEAATAAGADPIGLVGLWRVDAPGESVDTWLRLHPVGAVLWRECGWLDLSWDASETTFVAGAIASSQGCVAGASAPTVPWLEAASSFRAWGEGWQLVDDDGVVRATLRIDGAPEPDPDITDEYARSPVVDDEAHAWLAPPAPVPERLVPARADELVGRWVPVGVSVGGDPHVEVASDQTWRGSDGCNWDSGRWRLGDEGRLLTTAGFTTLIYCEGAGVPSWWTLASRAGFDGVELVLLDGEGSELGRLQRG